MFLSPIRCLTADRRSTNHRARLAVESLEERATPAVRSVLPLDVAVNNTTTFHTVSDVLNSSGLAAGDIIQIEPGSSPGQLFDNLIPSLTNLTLRGNPLASTTELPVIEFGNAVTITAARAGFTFQNLHLLSDTTLTFSANGTLRDVLLDSTVNNHAVVLNGTTAATIVNSRIITTRGGNVAQGIIGVATAAGSNNLISGNFLSTQISNSITPVISYTGANVISDRIEHNRLDGKGSSPALLVGGGVDGLVIQDNEIAATSNGVNIQAGARNIVIRRNQFEMSSNSSGAGVRVEVTNGATTTATIANNVFSIAAGNGIHIDTVATTGGGVSAKIEGNDFHGSTIGVLIDVLAGTIDLGGGALGSLGGNNFRGFTAAASAAAGAIVAAPNSTSASTYSAQRNLFGVANPETVIFDKNDSAALADINPASNLTGNAAFVQALYQKFLNRSGDTTNPADAGGWVNVLNGGATTFSVANGIARSPEASGVIVDGLFHRHLHRAPDAGSRQVFVNQLVAGFGIEFVTKEILASQEYTNYHVSDAAYVQSLFLNLLGRVPSNGEVLGFSPSPNGGNRLALADIFLFSTEFRNREVLTLYNDVLHRGASAAEVSSWVNTGLDVQSILINFASSAEFFVNG